VSFLCHGSKLHPTPSSSTALPAGNQQCDPHVLLSLSFLGRFLYRLGASFPSFPPPPRLASTHKALPQRPVAPSTSSPSLPALPPSLPPPPRLARCTRGTSPETRGSRYVVSIPSLASLPSSLLLLAWHGAHEALPQRPRLQVRRLPPSSTALGSLTLPSSLLPFLPLFFPPLFSSPYGTS